MDTFQRIIKNVGMLFFSQVLNSVLGFILLIFIARNLGEVEFGKYSFALSFTGLFVIFADIGINDFIIRKIARNKELINEYFINASIIKLILSLITFCFIMLIIKLMNYPVDTTLAVYIFGIYTILTSFAMMFRSIFIAFEKVEYHATIMIIEKAILLSLALFVLFSGYGLIELGYIYIFVGIVNVILSLSTVLIKFAKLKPIINFLLCKALIIDSIPFGLNLLFGLLFFKIDTVMLSILKGDASVGIYNSAYKPLLSLCIIPTAVIAAIYPVMSRYFMSSKDSLETLTHLSFKYMAIIGFPIAVGCIVFANKFITLFYNSQYSSAVPAFQILSIFIPLRFLNSISGTFLTSINKQGIRTTNVGISSLFNILLNALMIPYLSFIGASIATVFSEIFLFLIFIYFINKYYKKLKLHKYFLKPIAASFLMGVVLLHSGIENLLILVVSGGAFYFTILLLLRTFTRMDKEILQKLIKKKLSI